MTGAVIDSSVLAGWTPVRVVGGARGESVQWANFGTAQFDEPFFERTIQAHLRRPGSRVVQTPVDALEGFADVADCLSPGGFVFHMGRSGSTLFANALKARRATLMISEPTPVNQLLASADRDQRPERWDTRLRGLIAALGQRRAPGQDRYLLKFSSHNLLAIGSILRAFPEVPWLFLYREPVEVMVSMLGRPPAWLDLHRQPTAAAALTGLPANRMVGISPAEFSSLVLGRLMAMALEARSRHGAVLNYDQLTPESPDAVTGHFGFRMEAKDRELAEQAFKVHSKAADGRAFVPDAAEKRREASPELQRLCERDLRAPYEALEAVRLTDSW